jgi:hypothetical protein
MADLPVVVDLLRNPVGTPYDEPAGEAALALGQGATLFGLLKGILQQLIIANQKPDEVSNPEA